MHPERHFIHRLESLRGLAALAVVIHHAFMFVRYDPASGKYFRGIEAVFYGHGAVLCFFVLSGYVLGQSLRRQDSFTLRSYFAFCLKRCFRILPAFVVSIVISYIFYRAFGLWKFSTEASSSKYLDAYKFAPDLSTLIQNITFQKFQLNPVVWTLVPELLCSFLLPLLHGISRSNVVRWSIFATLVGIWVLIPTTNPPIISWASYLWIFYLGYLIPLCPESIFRTFNRHPFLVPLICIVSAVVCVLVPHFGHNEMAYTLAVSLLITLIAGLPTNRIFAILDLSIIRFSGQISYSLYLLHFPIAFSLAGALFYVFPASHIVHDSIFFATLLAITSIVATLPLAFLLYTYIERPFIAYGKAHLRRLSHVEAR